MSMLIFIFLIILKIYKIKSYNVANRKGKYKNLMLFAIFNTFHYSVMIVPIPKYKQE